MSYQRLFFFANVSNFKKHLPFMKLASFFHVNLGFMQPPQYKLCQLGYITHRDIK